MTLIAYESYLQSSIEGYDTEKNPYKKMYFWHYEKRRTRKDIEWSRKFNSFYDVKFNILINLGQAAFYMMLIIFIDWRKMNSFKGKDNKEKT